jgi:hypothetical protein
MAADGEGADGGAGVRGCGRINSSTLGRNTLMDMPVTKAILLTICFFGLASFQQPAYRYGFFISTHLIGKIPQHIKVQVANYGHDPVRLSNLVFSFYADNEIFEGTWEKVRFEKNALVLGQKQIFSRTIDFDSLSFWGGGQGQMIPIGEVKKKLRRSKGIMVQATMSDMRRLENLMESSSLARSNAVELRE